MTLPVSQRPPTAAQISLASAIKTQLQQDAIATMPAMSQQVVLVPKVVYMPYMEAFPTGPLLVKNFTASQGQQTTTTTTEASPDQVKQLNDVIANLKQKLERIEKSAGTPAAVAPPPVEIIPSFPIAPTPELPPAPLPPGPRHPLLHHGVLSPPRQINIVPASRNIAVGDNTGAMNP